MELGFNIRLLKDISELEDRLEETCKEARRSGECKNLTGVPEEGEGAWARGLCLYNPALTSHRM